MVIGAVLTQSAAWTNVERAIQNLKQAGVFSPKGLNRIPEKKLADLIKPSGYFNMKARKVKAFIEHLWKYYNGDLDTMLSNDADELRQELLGIYGIGEETADDIVLYAAGRPLFVIDAYTRRIFTRLKMEAKKDSYAAWQEFFHQHLTRDPALFNEYHALLVRHGKDTCKKVPICHGCCLLEMCPTGQKNTRKRPRGSPKTR
jgi:endonuclease-3 related protein